MPPESVSADPGWDEDLTWLDRDPMTAAEFEASLDRLCELDEGYRRGGDEDSDALFTAEELAGTVEAAAHELLAAKAASNRAAGPGQPGSARTFPGESSQPLVRCVRPGDAPGRAARLRLPGSWPPTPRLVRTAGSPVSRRRSWSG